MEVSPQRTLKLRSLSDSAAQISANHVFSVCLRFTDHFFARHEARFEGIAGSMCRVTIDKNNIVLYCYEEFINMVEFVLYIDTDEGDIFVPYGPRLFEVKVNELSEAILAEFRDSYFSIIEHLALTSDKRSHNIDLPELMWTSRTAAIEGGQTEAIAFHRRWASVEPIPKRIDGKNFYIISWGNSTVFGAEINANLKIFEEVKRTVQYIYACTFILREQTGHFFFDLVRFRDKIRESNIRPFREMEISLFRLENCLGELDHFYQGSRFAIFEEFLKKWRLSDLIEDVYGKIEKANKILSYISSRRRQRVQSRLKSLLISIGTLELLGVCVELIDLSDSTELSHWNSFGLVAVIRGMNPSLLLNGLLIALALLIGCILISGTEETGEK